MNRAATRRCREVPARVGGRFAAGRQFGQGNWRILHGSRRQLTRGPSNYFFGYIGQCRTIPWNASGRYVLALETMFQDRLPGAGAAAGICLIDTRNDYRVRVVDRTLGWNPQQGTMFYWNPEHPETQFFFNYRDPKTGKVFTVRFDISRGPAGERFREYRFDDTPVGNGGVAQNGGYFLAINYARMARLRPVTGYKDAWDWTTKVGAPADDGIFRVDVKTGTKRLIVSFAQLKEKLRPVDSRIEARHLFINHTLNNRNNDLVYFYCRADFEGEREKRLNVPFTVRPDGSELTAHETFIGGQNRFAVLLLARMNSGRSPKDWDICSQTLVKMSASVKNAG